MNVVGDVIGGHGDSSGFVFGCYSFIDKSGTGLLLFFITGSSLYGEIEYMRWVTVTVPLLVIFVSFILMLTTEIKETKS